MEKAFQERKNKIKDFKEDLISLNYIKDRNPFKTVEIPLNVIKVCPACHQNILNEDLRANQYVCPLCKHHYPLNMNRRLRYTVDEYIPYLHDLELNEFNFDGYEEKYHEYQNKTSLKDALGCFFAKIKEVDVALAILDSSFMMGSMGSVVGDKLTSFIEIATRKKLPLIIFSASGGARMQEGIVSLIQMAKTSAALANFKEKNILYISVLTHPTTGGVSASFASLGDITIAEPKALIGFAGKRVIENTIKEKLPEEFQTSEFLLEKGFLDLIVERKDLKETLYNILKLHNY